MIISSERATPVALRIMSATGVARSNDGAPCGGGGGGRDGWQKLNKTLARLQRIAAKASGSAWQLAVPPGFAAFPAFPTPPPRHCGRRVSAVSATPLPPDASMSVLEP